MEAVAGQRTRGRILAWILAGILPLMILLMGMLVLLGDGIATGSFIITYLVLPVLGYTGCLLVIRKKWRPVVRSVVCVVILAILFFGFVFMQAVGHFSIYSVSEGESAAADYSRDTRDISCMPEIGEIGTPLEMEYHSFYNQIALFFESDCYMLFCRYAEEEYARQQENLEKAYTFQTEPLEAHGYEVPPVVCYDGYAFRFLAFDGYERVFPKYMMLIATNSDTCEIVYIWFDDDDLDYIASMEEHIQNDFGWKYIK